MGADPVDSALLYDRLPGLAAARDADVMRVRLQALLVAPTHLVVDCRPGTLHYRGPAGCDLRYAVRLRPLAGGPPVSATVLGRVLSSPERARRYLRTRVDPLRPPGTPGPGTPGPGIPDRASPWSGPFATAAALAPGLGLVLHVFPLDPALPTLAGACDPLALRRALPAAFRSAQCTVEVLRHARDGRCVLRYTLPAGGARLYGKVHADRTGAAQQHLLAWLGPAVAGELAVPRPLGYAAALHTLVCAEVPGRRADLADPGEPPRAVLAAARAAAVLHALPTVGALSAGTLTAGTQPRSLAADVAALQADLDVLRPVWPEHAARLAAELAAVQERAARTPAQRPGFTHGDLTPAQLLDDPTTGTGIVDFDAAGLAEPALDLGRYRCYLRLARAKAGHPDGRQLADTFLAGYTDAARLGRRDAAALAARVALHERLSLLRVAARACAHLKSDRLRTALALL